MQVIVSCSPVTDFCQEKLVCLVRLNYVCFIFNCLLFLKFNTIYFYTDIKIND